MPRVNTRSFGSNRNGSHDSRFCLVGLNEIIRKNFQWTTALIVALTLVLLVSHRHLVIVFTRIPDVLGLYEEFSVWLLLCPVASGFGLTVYGIFTGSGTTRPVRNSTFLALLVFLGTLALTRDTLHNHGLWLAFSLFYLGRFVFLYPYMAEVRKKCISP